MKLIQIISILALSIFIAGCTTGGGGINAQALIEANAQIQTLLEEYPNANLDITYYSINESSQLEEEYNSICSKNFTQKALYRFSLQDESQNLKVVGYLNSDEQVVECLNRVGSEGENSEMNSQENNQSVVNESENNSSMKNNSNLYYEIKAEFEGISPDNNERVFLNNIKRFVQEHNSTFSLEFEISREDNETSVEQEGSVNSQKINSQWDNLLSSIQRNIERSENSEEIEVEIEISLKEKTNESYENSFEIEVDDVKDSKEEKSDKGKNETEVEVEIEIDKNTGQATVEIEINNKEYEREYSTGDIEEIKQDIANEFDLDYNLVAQNTEVEYKYSDDKKEEKEKEEVQFEIEDVNIQEVNGEYVATVTINNKNVSSGEFIDVYFELDGVVSRESVTIEVASSTQTFKLVDVLSNYDDLKNGKEYELVIRIDDSEKSEKFTYDENSGDFDLNIVDLVQSPSTGVESGEAVIANVEVENSGSSDIDKISIELSVNELNIETISYLYNIEEGDSITSDDMYVEVPQNAQAGIYDSKIKITDFNTKEILDEATFDFVVLQKDETSNDNLIIAKPDSIELLDNQILFNITIGNPSTSSKTISVVPEDISWGVVDTNPTFGTIQSGQDRIFTINLSLSSENTEENKTLKLNIKDDQNIVSQTEVLVKSN
ncbi:MAG: hypothetical protein ACLFPL_05680 [Candidatus Nanoarchaeia archaeon]